jgi:hypothetical protein
MASAFVVGLFLSGVTFAMEQEGWEQIQSGAVTVKTRARPGTPIKEVWAEGDLDASVPDIQRVLTDIERLKEFMPYLRESRTLDGAPPGAVYAYGLFVFPLFVSSRDFIHQSYLDQDAAGDVHGTFANHWFAVPDRVPPRSGVIRLHLSEGSWRVTPLPQARAHVVHRVSVDPAGMVPAVAANMMTAQGEAGSFRSIEREAKQRAAERPPPPSR